MMKTMMTAAILAALTSTAVAQEMDKETMLGWSGNVNASFNQSAGNTDSTDFAAGVLGRRDWAQWALEMKAEGRTARDNGIRNAEKYLAGLKGERKLNDAANGYLFAEADYTVDNFSGYDFQATQTVGYGRDVFVGANTYLKGEFGLGARESETILGVEETEFVARPKLKFGWDINESVTFEQDLTSTIGSEYTVTEAESRLMNKLTEALDLVVKYNLKNTSAVPANRKETDTNLSVGVAYAF